MDKNLSVFHIGKIEIENSNIKAAGTICPRRSSFPVRRFIV